MSSVNRINTYNPQVKFCSAPIKTPTKQSGFVENNNTAKSESRALLQGYKPVFKGEFSAYRANSTSARLIELIKKNKANEALEMIMGLKEDAFNPNYKSCIHDGSLIQLIADRLADLKKGEKYNIYSDIAHMIIYHKKFDPNQKCRVYTRYDDSEWEDQHIVEYLAHKNLGSLIDAISTKDNIQIDKEDVDALIEMLKTKNKGYTTTGTYGETLVGLKNIQSKLKTQEVKRTKEMQDKVEKPVKSEIEEYRVDTAKICPQGLDNVGGMEEAKAEIDEFIIKPWNPKYRKALKENGIKMPNGFLMYGPPGCGKTFITAAVAQEMRLPMYEINLSEIGTSAGHETEKQLGEIFKAIENKYRKTGKPSILFLDEIDAVCGRRDNSHTDWRRDETSTILKLMNNASDKGIILIGATNLLSYVDPAALRTGRFDKKIEIKKPDEKERKAIFITLAKNKPMANSVNTMIKTLVKLTDNYTSSDISAVFYQAMRSAVYNNQDIVTMKNFEDAISKIGSSIELTQKAEKGTSYSETRLGFNPQ